MSQLSPLSPHRIRLRVLLATVVTLFVVVLSAGAGSARASSAEVTPQTFENDSVRVVVTPSASSKYRADIKVTDIRGYSRLRSCGFTSPFDCVSSAASKIWGGIKWVKRNGLNIAQCSFAIALAAVPTGKFLRYAKKLGGPKGVTELIAASRNEGVFIQKLKGKIGKNWKDAAATFLGVDQIKAQCFGK